MIALLVSTMSLGRFTIDPSVLYGWEAKVLAHTADVLGFLLVVFIVLFLWNLFFAKPSCEDKSKKQPTDVGSINKEIRERLERIRARRK